MRLHTDRGEIAVLVFLTISLFIIFGLLGRSCAEHDIEYQPDYHSQIVE